MKEQTNYSIHHISINVKNMEISKQFYHKLGFTDFFCYCDDEVLIEHLDNKGIILELFCYKNVHEYYYEPFQLKTHYSFIGCEHFSLSVENINEAYVELKPFIEKNAVVTQGRTGIKYFFIIDPDGNRIEIVEDKRREHEKEGQITKNSS